MKAHLDSENSYYRYNEESVKAQLKPKSNKDYARIGAIIFTFTVLSIVIGLSIYTAIQIAYGYDLLYHAVSAQPVEFKTYTNNDLNFTIQHTRCYFFRE